jgi:putative iron-only hydrogenase system regulator
MVTLLTRWYKLAVPLTIFGIMVDNRGENAPNMQDVITKYGRDIICRMGVPSPSKEQGLITLVYEGDPKQATVFRKDLEDISGITVQTMSFPQ